MNDPTRLRAAAPARLSVRSLAARLGTIAQPRYGWIAGLVYLGLALPVVVFHGFVLPPGQVPDETNHFLRAIQLSGGTVIGMRISERAAGGVVPGAATEALAPFEGLKFRPDRRVDLAALQQARQLRWDAHGTSVTDFANTVIYPPFFYGVAALAITAGRAAGLQVLDTFYLARLANGVTAVMLSAIAIAAAVRGRALLLANLLLPGTLGLYGSASQDALLISSIALAAGLCSRAAHDAASLGDRYRVLVAAILGAAAAARPPYFAFVALLACEPLRRRWGASGSGRLVAALPLLLFAAAIPLIWISVGAAPLKVPFREADPAGQMRFLMEHPAALLVAGYHTFERYGYLTFQQFIGVLGWLDTYFTSGYYFAAGCALSAGVIASVGSPGRGLSRADALLVAAAVLCSFGGLYLLQYLTWSPVKSDWIDGVQGRYFIALVCVAAVALPSLADRGGSPARSTDNEPVPLFVTLCWGVVLAFGALNLLVVPVLLFARYYG